MKPIYLTIAGLHSFRERQVIDFHTLTEMGMFGIFGPTGSGKSTILDAITLALYGDVGRAGHNTQAILNHAEKQLEVVFEFEIGGFGRRKRYRVERMYKRGTGFSVEHQSSRLLELEIDDGAHSQGIVVLADSKNQVGQMIREILGLEQRDFTRAVVLPQGKFAEFLQLTGSDRNAMTERLFALEKYGKALYERVQSEFKLVDAAHQSLVAKQAELGDASNEAVAFAEAEVETAQVQLHAAEMVQVEAKWRLESATKIRQWTKELQLAKENLEALLVKSTEIDRLRVSLEQSAQANHVWPFVEAWRKKRAAALEAVSVQQARRSEEEQVGMMQAEVRARTTQVEREFAEMEPKLRVKLARLDEARSIEAQLRDDESKLAAFIKAYDDALARKTAVDAERDVSAQTLKTLTTSRSTAQAEFDMYTTPLELRLQLAVVRRAYTDVQQAMQVEQFAREQFAVRGEQERQAGEKVREAAAKVWHIEQEKQQWVDAVQHHALSAPRLSEADLASLQSWLRDVGVQVQALRGTEERLSEAQAKQTQAYDFYRKATETVEALQAQASMYEQALKEADESRAMLYASTEHRLIQALASRLVENEPCPVCGSPHHPQPAYLTNAPSIDKEAVNSADFDSAVAKAQDAWKQADGSLREAEATRAKLHAAAELAETEAARLEREYAYGAGLLDAFWPPLLVKFPTSQVPQDSAGWLEVTAHVAGIVANTEQAWELWRSERSIFAEQDIHLNRQLQEHITARMVEEANHARLVEELKGQAALLEAAVAGLTAAELVLRQCLQKTDIRAELSGVSTALNAAETRLTQLEEDDARVAELQKSLTALEKQRMSAQVEFDACQSQVQSAEQRLHEYAVQRNQLEGQVQTVREILLQLTDGCTVTEALSETQKTLAEWQRSYREALQQMKYAEQQLQNAVQALRIAEAECKLHQDAAAEAESRFAKVMAHAGYATPQAVEDARLSEAEQREGAETINAYETAVQVWSTRCNELAEYLDGRTLTDEVFITLQHNAVLAEKNCRMAIEGLGSLRERLKETTQRHARWGALEQERLSIAATRARVSALQSALRGNGFVQYLARAQMTRVAGEASERLSALTRGRYALVLTEDGSFLMQDNHNGGVRRPVSTLSGGETFLTSLALALALSAQIQLRGQHPLEFFFLDEGFGTLDPDLLDTVITALEKLNLARLSVGLISHVPELRQRMQRRLIVTPAAPAGRGTVVTLEQA